VIAYLSAGAFFYFRQGTLLFPAPTSFAKTTPADNRLEFEDLRIPVNVTDNIHAWWIPSVTSSGKIILVFHGNGHVLEDMVEAEVANLHQIGANLPLVDYRGYGSSTPISPDEATVNEDAEAALSYLMRRRRVPAGKVFVLGRLIGRSQRRAQRLVGDRWGGADTRAAEIPRDGTLKPAQAAFFFQTPHPILDGPRSIPQQHRASARHAVRHQQG
jgi:hypothetical protein